MVSPQLDFSVSDSFRENLLLNLIHDELYQLRMNFNVTLHLTVPNNYHISITEAF